MRTTLKFPNDVLIRGRKVAGILAEATEGRVVLGIGVNVNVAARTRCPTDVRTPATSLLAETGRRSTGACCSPRCWSGSSAATTPGKRGYG